MTREQPERAVLLDVLRTLGALPWLRLWRASVGVARTLDGERIRSFGIRGQADLSGILEGGVRLEVECKTDVGRQSKSQRIFQSVIEKYGGVYIVARSGRDALEQLRERGFPSGDERTTGAGCDRVPGP